MENNEELYDAVIVSAKLELDGIIELICKIRVTLDDSACVWFEVGAEKNVLNFFGSTELKGLIGMHLGLGINFGHIISITNDNGEKLLIPEPNEDK